MQIDQSRTKSVFQKLERVVSKLASDATAKGVHDFRTTSRRVETLISELLPKPSRSARKLRKQLAKFRKRAGRVRDLDVQTAALESLNTGRDVAQKRLLQEALLSERRRLGKKLVAGLEDDELKSLRKRSRRSAKEVLATRVEFDPVARALRDFADLAHREGEVSETKLHPYRLCCKHIRYVAEMAGNQSAGRAVVEELKKIQDAVGEWHDWQILTARAAKVLSDFTNPTIVHTLRSATHAKLRDALRIAREAKERLLEMRAPSSLKPAKSVRDKRNKNEIASAAVA
jgi:CHAD domain-containing protein